jgi:hypothetical protein
MVTAEGLTSRYGFTHVWRIALNEETSSVNAEGISWSTPSAVLIHVRTEANVSRGATFDKNGELHDSRPTHRDLSGT